MYLSKSGDEEIRPLKSRPGRNDRDDGLAVYLVHLPNLLDFILSIVLDNTQGIYPQVRYPE